MLLQLALPIILTLQFSYCKESKCVAGVNFLKSTASPDISNVHNTYVMFIKYPCNQDPYEHVQKIKKKINDPFVSYFLKTRSKNRVKRNDFEGSGDEYDDDDDDEEEEDEDEEDNEIEYDHKIQPSEHIVVPQPTPSHDHVYSSELYSPVYIPDQSFSINPTKSFVLSSSIEDVFQNLGSGDGPIVLSTPTYDPSTTSNTYEPVSSYSSPTPPLGYVRNRIPKQIAMEGQLHVLKIPEHTFEPKCESYRISPQESWVDLKSNVLSFFPVQNHTSEWTFNLICDHLASASTPVIVNVRQSQKSRLYNHAFEIEFGMIREQYTKVELLQKLEREVTSSLGGNNNSFVVLWYELDSYPYRISYVNESLISNVCPVEEMKVIYTSLQNLNRFIKVENVKLHIPVNNQCDNDVIGLVTGNNPEHVAENFPPSIKNQIDMLNGTVGKYFVYPVKRDFCYDPEDGETNNLNLNLKTSEFNQLDEAYWLQFDGKNQEFYGLPMAASETEFVLVCGDKKGKTANDVLLMSIRETQIPETSYNAEFSVHFQSIPFTPKSIRKFIEKLSQILSEEIHVIEYSESNNHVLFKWFNTTNPSTEHEVTEIRKVLLGDDGPVNKRFYNHFTPEFNITVASVIPRRGLLSENNPKSEIVGGETSGYLTTYIIPSVLIAIMILLALIIACLLSRKNKYTQASTEDDSPNSRVYLKNAKKGVPIILEAEYDEKLFGNELRGNIYEPQLPRSGTGTPRPHIPVTDTCSSGMNSPRVTSPNPLPRSFTPLPPDYTSSINRNNSKPRFHNISSPPNYELRERSNESYAPPAPISYYGIHNSNTGNFNYGKNGMPPPYVPP